MRVASLKPCVARIRSGLNPAATLYSELYAVEALTAGVGGCSANLPYATPPPFCNPAPAWNVTALPTGACNIMSNGCREFR